jgi:hypothetical protein
MHSLQKVTEFSKLKFIKKIEKKILHVFLRKIRDFFVAHVADGAVRAYDLGVFVHLVVLMEVVHTDCVVGFVTTKTENLKIINGQTFLQDCLCCCC